MAQVVKNKTKKQTKTSANAGDTREVGLIPGLGRSMPWRQSNPVFLPRESLGQRSLAGYSAWGRKELDTTEATEHAHMRSIKGQKNQHLMDRSVYQVI